MPGLIWVDIDEDEPIRQGDIIRCETDQGIEWKFILTADCDIAQNKSGEFYTWLEIKKAVDWLDLHWAPLQLKRVLEKQVRIALEVLNAEIAREHPALRKLDSDGLKQWLAGTSVGDLIIAVFPRGARDQKLVKAVEIIKVIEEAGFRDLNLLRRVNEIQGKKVEELKSLIQDAFSGGGFPDFFFLPELPAENSLGFMVLLRGMDSVQTSAVFRSKRHARLSDNPKAHHRIGRLNDRLRFAISQKLSFLFSRIGLHPEFEAACEEAAELLSGDLGQAMEGCNVN